MLPFTRAQFLALFAQYNLGVWPAQAVVYALGTSSLSESSQGIPFEDFVSGMFEAGADESLDVFALHAFARDASGSVAAAETTRSLLTELHSRVPIWITEIGWASGGPASPFTSDEQGQATRIRAALGALVRRRAELGLLGVIYFNWRDAPVYEGGQDFFGLHTGLVGAEGNPKPALDAYRSVAVRNAG